MTLNITVLTANRLFHSSDFRLSNPDGSAFDAPAMKMSSVDYPTFHGFIYYTGIARLPGADKDTGDYIEEWLSTTADMHFFQVVEHLRMSATAYIRALPSSEPLSRRLTIVAAAFVRDRPVAAIISNFESADGIFSTSTSAEFQQSWVRLRPGEGPVVLVTGKKAAVSANERASLRGEIADAGEDARRIRTALQATNRRAARNPIAKETISEECVVVSTDFTNRGNLEMGDQPGLTLRSIRNGSDFSLDSILESLGIAVEGQVRSAAFATSRRAEPRPSDCKKETVDLGRSGYSMTSILDADGVGVAVFGLSASGAVLGAHALPDDPSRHKYWIWSGGDALDYLDVGESYTTSGCISVSGEIVVVVGTQQEPMIVRVDSSGHVCGRLKIPPGMAGPSVTSMNASGGVVGSIEVNRETTDGSRQKPAHWNHLGEASILRDMFEGQSGQAVAINDSGESLIFAHYPWFGVVPIVWNPASGEVHRLPGSIIPIAWAADDEIVGFDRSQGRDAPALLRRPGDWKNVPVNNGFHPHAANRQASIAGVVIVDGYETPWIMKRDEAPVLLPTYRYHSANVRFLGDDGTAVGTVSANEEHHVVVWSAGDSH